MEKKNIFISHIGEEASLGIVLKDWIESTFSGNCDVFLSSDINDIAAGDKWFDNIDEALNDSNIMIVLCSENSISRPWINFEAGCGWIKELPIISICYLGVSKSSLPEPLSRFQNLNLEDDNFISDLFLSLKKHFNLTKIPKIDKKEMETELNRALEQIKTEAPLPKSKEKHKINVQEEKITDIPGEARDALLLMSKGRKTIDVTPKYLAEMFGMSEQKMRYFLDILHEHKLVEELSAFGQISYCLNSDGRKYLFENGLL
ncbi:MAG: hypothetical protein DHS20C13_02590 [Thermodesulfobacteriota bacterium]|nr:MAG: hypothetical protein DHS20C13_02590 [Thermodesulfobacteriota bacterium]